jgi:hypothetical protein
LGNALWDSVVGSFNFASFFTLIISYRINEITRILLDDEITQGVTLSS